MLHIFTLSGLTDNFQNPRKKGKKREKKLSFSSLPEVFYKKGVLKTFAKFAGKQPEACSFIKNETLAQVFFCDFSEIF